MNYKEYIKHKKDKWIGKKVSYEGNEYTVIDIDYNGSLMINKMNDFNDTTAVTEFMIKTL